jgi:predicted nucleic acid-binding protein
MILADTSVWIDHLRQSDDQLVHLLQSNLVVIHPIIIGEIALGSLKDRSPVLSSLADLPEVVVAEHGAVLALIEQKALMGTGIGFADAHLLASVLLTAGAKIWTRDKRLSAQAMQLGINFTSH